MIPAISSFSPAAPLPPAAPVVAPAPSALDRAPAFAPPEAAPAAEPLEPGAAVERAPSAAVAGSVDRTLADLDAVRARVEALLARSDAFYAGHPPPSAAQQSAFQQRTAGDLLRLQLDLGEAGFRVQFLSKLLEHGTSSVKTVLQTQM